jgi:hypothetical protein
MQDVDGRVQPQATPPAPPPLYVLPPPPPAPTHIAYTHVMSAGIVTDPVDVIVCCNLSPCGDAIEL